MATEDLYKNDLIHRYASHTFEETTTGSLINVKFKNASSVVIGESTKLVLIDAYRAIRGNLLIGENPIFRSTTTQRDALSGVDAGVLIDNITTGFIERYSGTAWGSVAGTGTMLPTAYGNLYEDSSTGSAMNPTTKQWITANAGKFDNNGLISFLNHADGDRLVVGTGGAGDYMIVASCGQTNSGNGRSAMTVHINDVDNTVVKDDQNASSAEHRPLVANGILELADDDYLTVHVVDPATPANEIKVFDCHLTIQRIS